MHQTGGLHLGVSSVVPIDFDEIRDLISRLPSHQQIELAKSILGDQPISALTWDGANTVDSGLASFRFGSAQQMLEHLNNYSREDVELIIKGLAMWFEQHRAS